MKTTRINRWLAPLALSALALPLGGCQFLRDRLGSAAYFTATSAGYAGRYRLANGQWPPNVGVLEEFMCMPGRADRHGLLQLSCDEVVSLPYRMELTPQGEDLRVRYFDKSDGALLCTLRLHAPRAGVDTDTFPKFIIRSTIFSCERLPSRGMWNHTSGAAT